MPLRLGPNGLPDFSRKFSYSGAGNHQLFRSLRSDEGAHILIQTPHGGSGSKYAPIPGWIARVLHPRLLELFQNAPGQAFSRLSRNVVLTAL